MNNQQIFFGSHRSESGFWIHNDNIKCDSINGRQNMMSNEITIKNGKVFSSACDVTG